MKIIVFENSAAMAKHGPRLSVGPRANEIDSFSPGYPQREAE
jgi:hypothetical protein